MPIACSSSGSFTDCFQSANAWAYFISEFQSGTRGGQLISIYGYAEGQGAHYGVDLAYAVNGRSASSLSSEAEFRTLLASADVYRDGQMFPITKGIPLFHPTSDTVAYGGILAFEGALHSIGAKFP
jgi:hypothetical protein